MDQPAASSSQPRWPAAWVRALLPTAILASLEQRPLHGYGIAQSVGAIGFGVPRGGSLYPALARLEEAGAVETAWVPGASGPARREYTLTPSGRSRLAQERTSLEALASALHASVPDDPSSELPALHTAPIGGIDHDRR